MRPKKIQRREENNFTPDLQKGFKYGVFGDGWIMLIRDKRYKEAQRDKNRVLSALVECIVPKHDLLMDGDRFTVQGIRLRSDGTYTNRCKRGDETVFIAKNVKERGFY